VMDQARGSHTLEGLVENQVVPMEVVHDLVMVDDDSSWAFAIGWGEADDWDETAFLVEQDQGPLVVQVMAKILYGEVAFDNLWVAVRTGHIRPYYWEVILGLLVGNSQVTPENGTCSYQHLIVDVDDDDDVSVVHLGITSDGGKVLNLCHPFDWLESLWLPANQ